MRYSDFKHTAKHASAQAKHASAQAKHASAQAKHAGAQREQTKMQGKHARRETFLVGKRVGEGANIGAHMGVRTTILSFEGRLVHLVAAALLLVALAVPVTAVPVMLNAEEAAQNTDVLQGQASGAGVAVADISGSAEKKEVVYATLANAGTTENVYVVNVFDEGINAAGKTIRDFGVYDQVVNLTNTSELTQFSDSVVLTMPEGEFSYQGTASNAQIPWNISLKYYLDGQEIAPNELAGKSGSFELSIETTKNDAVDPRYYENYLMQITCTLPMEVANNVKTEQGSIALSGSDVTVSFMVMPDAEGNVSLTAEVSNFEMAGISFAAIPFSMALDFPDTDSLVSQFDALIDGTEQLHSGAAELASGVDSVDAATKQAASGAAELATGATQITQGLQQYQQGLRDQAASTAESVSDAQIQAATAEYQAALGVYAAAYTQVYEAIIASYEESGVAVTDEIRQEALVQAAEKLKGSEQESNMTTALENLITLTSTQVAAQGAAQALNGAADGLGSVDNASSLLGGSASLGAGTQELASGLDQLAGGTGKLASGAATLTDGTQTLAQESQGIPDAVQAEIDELMATYDKSDFEPASFTSSKNTNVTLVQFVMTTDPIKVEEPAVEEEPVEEETLIDRFLALF